MKKVISLFLAIAISFSLATHVNAQTPNEISIGYSSDLNETTKTTVSDLISMAINDPNSDFSIGKYSIGTKIPTYVVAEFQVDVFEDAEHYPVYCDDILSGIFTINSANTDTQTYTFGSSFAEQLQKSFSSNESEVTLIVTETQVFSYEDGAIEEVVKYDIGGTDSSTQDNNSISMFSFSEGNDEKINTPEEYTSEEIASVLQNLDLDATLMESSNSDSLKVSFKGSRAWILAGSVAKEKQLPGSYQCWVISAKLTGKAETGKITPKNNNELGKLAGKNFGDVGGKAEIFKIWSSEYGLNSPGTYGRLKQAELLKQLKTKREPFIMRCKNITNTTGYGHAVTCYGLDNATSPYSLGIMDSLSGTTFYMTSSATGDNTLYRLTFSGTTYEYMDSYTPTLYSVA